MFGFDGLFVADRDKGMGNNIVERLQRTDLKSTVVLMLTGNLHARTNEERWMGWHVRKAFPQVVSLNNDFSGGSTWACTNDGCGPLALHGEDRGKAPFATFTNELDKYGYNGSFYVGKATASPPANKQGSPARNKN